MNDQEEEEESSGAGGDEYNGQRKRVMGDLEMGFETEVSLVLDLMEQEGNKNKGQGKVVGCEVSSLVGVMLGSRDGIEGLLVPGDHSDYSGRPFSSHSKPLLRNLRLLLCSHPPLPLLSITTNKRMGKGRRSRRVQSLLDLCYVLRLGTAKIRLAVLCWAGLVRR